MSSLYRVCVIALFLFACDANDRHIPNETVSTDTIPTAPLDILKAGNARVVAGRPIHPNVTLERIRELKSGQHPIVVILSCSDSRVPPELIFDQGFGNIFSIRTAGNVIGDFELASVEYAVEHLGVNTVLVLGHQDCGAVQAYLSDTANIRTAGHIKNLVEYIRQEEEEKALPEADRNSLSIAVYANILHGIHTLKQSEPILKPLSERKKITIMGALYNLENGKLSYVEH